MQEIVSFKQIALITDGQSNIGISPVLTAKKAKEHDIIVNVIGITEQGEAGIEGLKEIEDIAEAGGGMSQIVKIEQMAKTVQYVTQHSMNKTIKQVINTQLKQILGHEDIHRLPPKERIKIVDMMDQLSEHSHLDILLLIDVSASMRPKMVRIEEALMDFQLSVQSRAGTNRISIATFPAELEAMAIIVPWTKDIFEAQSLIANLTPSGNTPTGPAIEEAIAYFDLLKNKDRRGILDEYIV